MSATRFVSLCGAFSWLLLLTTSVLGQVNHNPSFIPGNDISVVMNAGAVVTSWATNITDNDGGGQILAFTATPANTQLFSGPISISSSGALSFTPATDRVGTSLVAISLSDDGSSTCATCAPPCSPANCRISTTHQLTVTVTPVNQCPSWSISQTSITVQENSAGTTQASFARSVTAGSASHESTQTLSWDLVVSETTLFSVLPTIDYTAGSSTGNLRFQPAPNANGQATVWVTLLDDGGASNGGCDRAPTKSFSIEVEPVNSNPSFVAGPNPVTVNENSGQYRRGGWATQITAGANELEQTTSFTVELVDSSHAALFKTLPAIDSSGQLTFEPELNKNSINRVVEVRVQLTDNLGGESCTLASCGRLRIVITPVNQEPVFTPGGDITVWEDRKDLSAGQSATFDWAKDITPGNNDEVTEGQTVRFVVTSTNSGLFSTPPAVSPTGVLSFTLNQYQNGASQVSVTIWDSENANQIGNTAEFALNVLPSNNAPMFSFVPAQPYTVLQNSKTTSIGTFITGLSPGPEAADDEDPQQVWMTVSGTPAEFFSQQPVLTATSSTTSKLDFTIADNKYGTATIHVTAHDDGGTVRRGVNQRTQTFTVNVQQVNAPPTFDLSEQLVTENENQFPVGRTLSSLVRSVTSGAFELTTGPTAQTVSLTVATTNSDLFATLPTVNAQGDVSYTVKADAFGTAVVSVTATDNGSPPLSTSKTFTLLVRPVNHAPSFIPGPNLTENLPECRSSPSCAYSLSGWATGTSVGPSNEQGQTHHFSFATGDAANLFGVPPAIDPSTGTLTFTLVPFANTVASGPRSMTVTMVDTGGTENGGVDRIQHTVWVSISPYAGQPSAALGNVLRLRRNGEPVTVSQFLTQIDSGSSSNTALDLTYTVVPTSPADFAGTPSVVPTTATSASISATPAPHVFGTKLAYVRIANPVTNLSTQIEFPVVIIFVNEAPSFNLTGDVQVFQGDTAFSNPLVTNISVGSGESALQQHSFTISCSTSDGRLLFATQPTVDVNGVFRCGLLPRVSGTADCSLLMRDTGGTADGGSDTAGPKRFTLRIVAVNRAPVFTASLTRVSVLQNSGPFTASRWAQSIGPGDGDQSLGQQLSFRLECCAESNVLFERDAAVDVTTGTLSFTPRANAHGTCACRVTLVDDGGGISPNVNTSAPVSVEISVQQVNQPPSFLISNRSITVIARSSEYSFAMFVTDVAAGPDSESSQTVRLSAIATSGSSVFVSSPALSASGTLSFTTAATASGVSSVSICAVDDGGTANGGVDRTCQVLGISVVAASLTPDFGVANRTVYQLQRAGSVTVSSFLTDLSTQSGSSSAVASVSMTGSNAAGCTEGFALFPTLDTRSGDLSFAARDVFHGVCTANITVRDGITGRGQSQVVAIIILQVNLAPTFTAGPTALTVPFDSREVSVAWGSQVSAGDAVESDVQTLRGVVTVLTAGVLVADSASIDANGVLRFNLTRNEPATVDLSIRYVDNGGTENGGSDTSSAATLRVTVVGINTAPSFVAPAAVQVFQGAGSKTVSQFATSLSPGSASWEQSQSLTFHVMTNETTAFVTFPTISSDGTLSFALAASYFGNVRIVVQLRDNGGTLHGGSDASLTREIDLGVVHVNSAPSFTVTQATIYVVQGVTTMVPHFVRDISAGDSNQSVALSADTEASFGAPLSVAFDLFTVTGGNLTVAPKRFYRGSVPVRIIATDTGTVANGGRNTFTATVTVVFLQRNAAPVAQVQSTVSVVTGSSLNHRVDGFVASLSAVEQDQTLTVSVAAASPALFSGVPPESRTVIFSVVVADTLADGQWRFGQHNVRRDACDQDAGRCADVPALAH